MPFIAIALIVAAALGGGTSFAAQSALPGDALWGFKVGVNENVRAALAAEGKAQADFDLSAIEERMREAAALAAKGRLNAEVQADIQGNFGAHAESVQKQILRLQEKGDYAAAADVAARFQATVATHATALANAKARASTNANANAQAVLGNLINKVQTTLDTASSLSADASAEAASSSSAGANANVQTGTSVQGGAGGINVNSETGVEVGN